MFTVVAPHVSHFDNIRIRLAPHVGHINSVQILILFTDYIV